MSEGSNSGNGRGAIRVALSPRAVILLAAPAALALLVLVLAGLLAWPAALGALLFVLAGSAVIVGRHLAHIERLRRSVEIFGREGPEAFGALRRLDDSLLSPGLEVALIAAAEERQQRRQEMEAAMTSNEAVLASLPDPLIMLNERRRVVRVNPAAKELFNQSLTGRDITDILRAPAVLQAVDAALAGRATRTAGSAPGGHQLVEFAIPGAVQRTFQARVARLPSTTLDGTLALLSLHDMTAVKRTEQLRADFVANASHELRTPLSSLLGFIETLRGPARDDDEARHRFLGIMHDQALRMTHLVEDLLSLSRIEMKEHSAPTGSADLDRMLRSVAGGLELRAKEKQMRIEVETRGAPAVVGDFEELAQVFQNLIDNAIKYGKAGTPVQVTLGDERAARQRLGRPAVAVCVRDQGEGISREHLPRLTERFYRVDKARSRQLGGTGLGLAIVKHIVNRHRGALEVTSNEGQGSTFTVLLPALDPALDPALSGGPEDPSESAAKNVRGGRDAAAE